MKKLMSLLAAFLMCSTMVMADLSCPVYGSSNSNVASVSPGYVKTSMGDYFSVYVTLTKTAAEDIGVVVSISDGNREVASTVVYIKKGKINGEAQVTSLSGAPGTYYISIARASCNK